VLCAYVVLRACFQALFLYPTKCHVPFIAI
jgi:hypothetical protein